TLHAKATSRDGEPDTSGAYVRSRPCEVYNAPRACKTAEFPLEVPRRMTKTTSSPPPPAGNIPRGRSLFGGKAVAPAEWVAPCWLPALRLMHQASRRPMARVRSVPCAAGGQGWHPARAARADGCDLRHHRQASFHQAAAADQCRWRCR